MSTDSAEMLARKQRALVPCVHHFYKQPPVFVRGAGMRLFDSSGKAYLDCFSGVSVNHLGHCHPDVTRAVCRQAETLCHTTTIHLTEPMIALAEQLSTIAPVDKAKVFFCASGSEANESAAHFVQAYAGQTGLVALDNSLHGNTKLAATLSGIPFWKTDLAPVDGVRHAAAPYCYRCPFGKTPATCRAECVDSIDDALRGLDRNAGAVFVEPIQGNGGIIVPPAQWFEKLATVVRKHNVLLVADEVQTALGRTGSMFACEQFGLRPDLVSMAKSLGGGLPMAAVLVSGTIAEHCRKPRASTFGGNPVAAAAGSAVIHVIQHDRLAAHAACMGRYFKERLAVLAHEFSVIGEVRGMGLMLGAELAGPDRRPEPVLLDRILEDMKDRGILLGKSGPHRNVLTFLPPLIIQQSDIDRIVHELESSLRFCLSGAF